MPFKLKFHADSTTGLVAVCDICGRTVTGADANILWLPGTLEIPGESSVDFRIVCQLGVCERIAESKFGHHYSQNLETAIGYLINNTKTDLKRVRRNMEILSQIG